MLRTYVFYSIHQFYNVFIQAREAKFMGFRSLPVALASKYLNLEILFFVILLSVFHFMSL